MPISKHFPFPLIVKHLNGVMWELMKRFEYCPDKGDIIKVPVGFKFDFASIPKIFWSFIGGPTGRYGPAALIHDFLYFSQTTTRSKADKILLAAMKILKVSWWRRRIMYYAVRMAANPIWKRHKKELAERLKDS